MRFMEDAFDRLDKDKSGELDIKEVPPGKLALARLTLDRHRKAIQQREQSGAET
jgi:hypothetical protein